MAPLSRLLQGCRDHTSGARMPPNPALLNGSVMARRLGKAGTLLNKEGDLEKVLFAIKTTLRLPKLWGMHQQKLSRGSAATKVWGALILHCVGELRRHVPTRVCHPSLGQRKGSE